jgi:hypothetical protein
MEEGREDCEKGKGRNVGEEMTQDIETLVEVLNKDKSLSDGFDEQYAALANSLHCLPQSYCLKIAIKKQVESKQWAAMAVKYRKG